MGNKNDTATPVSASAESPASKKTAPSANGAKTPRIAVKKKPAKAAAKKSVGFSTDDIALRAYFIAEHRHRHGVHGDEHSDWLEAERQLQAEHKKKAARPATRSKKRA